MSPVGYVLSLCDFTGVQARPWAEAGYECICADIKHAYAEEIVRFENGGLLR
jgi:hypothetical protein